MVTVMPGGTYLERALAEGYARLEVEGGRERIRYGDDKRSHRWVDPEEKVRAELWAELIYRYEYPAERIGVEVTVTGRTPNIYADLVIYRDDEGKSPYFVFECKREEVADPAFEQAIEQACGYRASLGAKYCGVVAGRTRRLLRFDRFPPGERERNIFTDIPVNYGNPPPWRFLKGGNGQDLPAVSREELRAAIRKCHQTLWEGGKRSPIVAFGEFCKLVFIKYRDEKNLDLQEGQPYHFQRREGETNRQLADRINRLYDAEQRQQPAVFTESINVEPPILAQCVEHLEGISLNNTELDTKGVAFEEFMGGFFKGDFGQYFTPRELIAFAVAMLQPSRTDLVLDPACGSGGFLLYALDYVRREADRHYPGHQTDPRQSVEHFRYWHDFAQNNLFGIEFNEALARVAKMNMIIHDDGHTNIVGHDALDFFAELNGRKGELAAGRFDLVLTNPPFGSVVRRSEKGDGYLEQFALRRYLNKNYQQIDAEVGGEGAAGGAKAGAKAVKEQASVKTEILFLERVHSFLKPGGRAAVVLPDGVLTNSSLQGIRHWLLENFQLLAVVSLPQSAFSHYDAGVKASIVFLQRRRDGERVADDEAIFMALAENIGYDATGRETFAKRVEREEPRQERVEIQSCDLFDYRVFYEWREGGVKGEAGWQERRRELIADTGLVGQYKEFQRDPTLFFSVSPAVRAKPECFAVRHRDVDGKLGADYYHPERTSALRMILSASQNAEVARLADVVSFERNQIKAPLGSYLGLAQVQSHTGELISATEQAAGSCYIYQEGDVLFARLRPYLNKVYLAESDGSCSTEFLVLRVKDRGFLSPEYLAVVLRSQLVLLQTTHMTTGNTLPRLANEDVENLRILIPDLEEQEAIVLEFNLRRENVRRILAEAESIQQETRRWIDEKLLGAVAL